MLISSSRITFLAAAIFALSESMKRKKGNNFAIRILENDSAYLSLDQRDRAFARMVLSTYERRSGQIELGKRALCPIFGDNPNKPRASFFQQKVLSKSRCPTLMTLGHGRCTIHPRFITALFPWRIF